nr:hypothetical protein [Tanacetum cinerariifolium]
DLLKKKKDIIESDSNSDNNLKFLPGFTPSFNAEEKSNDMKVQGEEDEHHSTDVQEAILSSNPIFTPPPQPYPVITSIITTSIVDTEFMLGLVLARIGSCPGMSNLALISSEFLGTLHKEISTVNLIVGADPTIRLRRESKDTIQLENAVSTISQEYLLEFTSEYGIPESLHLELPGPEDPVVEFPEGEVGVYTKFFEFANFHEKVFPTVVDWRTNAPKDKMPFAYSYFAVADTAFLITFF